LPAVSRSRRVRRAKFAGGFYDSYQGTASAVPKEC
jgi:hypothetical protein